MPDAAGDVLDPADPTLIRIVNAKVEALRRRLLDFSRRNPLIHLRISATSAAHIRVVDELPDLLRLKLTQGSMRLVALPPLDDELPDESTPRFLEELAVARQEDAEYKPAIAALDPSREGVEEEEERIERAMRDRVREQLGLPPRQTRVGTSLIQHARIHGIDPSHALPRPSSHGQEAERHGDDMIQTLLLPDRLAKLAKGLTEKARAFERETGVNVLHAAFGILEWQAPTEPAPASSPLIILECRIERRQTPRGPEFHVAGLDRPASNTTLVEALLSQHRLVLPVFEGGSFEEHFDAVAALAPPGWTWRVRREASIGLFPSSRIAMYHDLDPARHAVGSHPIVSRLLGSAGGSLGGFAGEHDVDAPEVAAKVPLTVLDADASQHSMLVDAAGGQSIALQGPPGSGKSQTIVNLIAAALADGKSVLFVAEKLTALDVVRSRLEAVGLGEFLLPLQAGKGTAEAVYASLEARHGLEVGHSSTRTGFARLTADLAENRARLRTHVDALAAPHEATGQSVHELLGQAIATAGELADLPPPLRRLAVPGVEAMTLSDIDRLAGEAGALGARLDRAAGMPALWREATARVAARDEADDHAALADDLAAALDLADDDLLGSDLAALIGPDPWGADLLEVAEAVGAVVRAAPDFDLVETALEAEPRRMMRILGELAAQRARLRARLTAILLDPDAESAEADLQAAAALAEAEGARVDPIALGGHVAEAEAAIAAMTDALEAARRLPAAWADRDVALDSVREVAAEILAAPPVLRAYSLSDPLGAMPALAREIGERRRQLLEDLEAIRRDLPRAGGQDSTILFAQASTLEMAGAFRFLSGTYKAARAAFVELGGRPDLPRDSMGRALRRLAAWIEAQAAFAAEARYRALFGAAFRGLDTDPEELAQLCALHGAIGRAAGGDPGLRQVLETVDPGALAPIVLLDERHVHHLRGSRAALAQRLEAERGRRDDARARAAEAARLAALFRDGAPVTLDHIREARDARARLRWLGQKIEAHPAAAIVSQHWPALIEDGATLGLACDITEALSRTPDPLTLLRALRSGQGPTVEAEALRLAAAREALDGRVATFAASLGLPFATAREALPRTRELRFAAADPGALLDRGRLLLAEAALRVAGLADLVDWALGETAAGRPPGEERLAGILRSLVASGLARAAVRRHGEAIQGFDGTALDRLRRDIAGRDRDALALSRKVLRDRLIVAAKPPHGVSWGRKADFTELALIEHELSKKARRLPPRELARRAARALLALKPCWMMSPLAVSQYLTGGLAFDLVVIDEASQMTPENAVGALRRGGQAVVVGDKQQLPPSSFFRKVVGPAGDEEDEEETGESVLDLATLTFSVSRQLRWHYRSRDSSLIRFSNAWMYDDRLTIFPSAEEGADDMGVSLFEVPGAYRAGTNPVEARAVVEAAVRHMAAHPELSLGVCTMNVDQKDLILEEFERERDRNFTVQAYVKAWEERADGLEEFFVKNLETIQGDERDVLLISTLYGPETPGGRVHQRFGPVNSVHGHRRLNVLFTRAKRRIITFTSLKPSDIMDEGKAKGVRMLRAWLEYSRTREVTTTAGSTGPLENPFEAHVASRIEAMGFEAVPQVGASGYRIDIGVRHPDWPWGFVLGVECDGASYHSSRSSRERDRLRQEILEGLGWRLHRIWSTDWFHDHARAEERLRVALDEALATARAKGPRRRAANVVVFPIPAAVPSAPVAHPPPAPEPSANGIRVGSRVMVERLGRDGGRMAFTLVRMGHDPSQGLVGDHTPLGEALIGAEEGETVEFRQGSYVAEVRVVSIRQPGEPEAAASP